MYCNTKHFFIQLSGLFVHKFLIFEQFLNRSSEPDCPDPWRRICTFINFHKIYVRRHLSTLSTGSLFEDPVPFSTGPFSVFYRFCTDFSTLSTFLRFELINILRIRDFVYIIQFFLFSGSRIAARKNQDTIFLHFLLFYLLFLYFFLNCRIIVGYLIEFFDFPCYNKDIKKRGS